MIAGRRLQSLYFLYIKKILHFDIYDFWHSSKTGAPTYLPIYYYLIRSIFDLTLLLTIRDILNRVVIHVNVPIDNI